MRHGARRFLSLALAGLLVSCGGGADQGSLSQEQLQGPRIVFTNDPPSEFDRLPGWRSELKSKVLAAFSVGCPGMTDKRYAKPCAAVAQVPAGDENAARLFLVQNFRPSLLGQDFMTGYFELDVKGSRVRTADYPVPVLRAPRDPQQYARPDIMGGALDGQGLEVLYLQSEVDLYFLQLQGSGRVTMTDGTLVRLGTAADNGQPRIPPQNLFGEAPIPNHDLSIPGIRAWAATHSPETNGRLARDQAYVYFHETPELPPIYGPYGAFGLPLLPMRSVAVDTATTPLGAMLWVNPIYYLGDTRLPHLVIAQDTGPLIKGPARIDLFFGWGPEAEQVGGHQHGKAQVWGLVPR